MASPHSVSMFGLPFMKNSTELAVAYKVYFVACISGGCVGLFGASLFLYRLKSEETTKTRRLMLVLLGLSNLLADTGRFTFLKFESAFMRTRMLHVRRCNFFLPPTSDLSLRDHSKVRILADRYNSPGSTVACAGWSYNS